MKKVYKYGIFPGSFRSTVPPGAVVLRVGGDGPHRFAMWALVDPKHAPATPSAALAMTATEAARRETKTREFYTAITGEPLPHWVDADNYIGTARNGNIVIHLFERKKI